MPKEKPEKGGSRIRKIEWRGSDVFACGSAGCTFAHERKDRVEQHVRAGRHQVPRSQGSSRAPTATQSDVEPESAAEDTDAKIEGGEQ